MLFLTGCEVNPFMTRFDCLWLGGHIGMLMILFAACRDKVNIILNCAYLYLQGVHQLVKITVPLEQLMETAQESVPAEAFSINKKPNTQTATRMLKILVCIEFFQI